MTKRIDRVEKEYFGTNFTFKLTVIVSEIMALLQKAKAANNENKLRVFGYIRQSAISCDLIMHLTLAYYNIPEYFKIFHTDYFKTSSNNYTITIIENNPSYHNTIYLHQNIKSMSSKIYKWTFKVNFRHSMKLGLDIDVTPIKQENTQIELCNSNTNLLNNGPIGRYQLSSGGCKLQYPGFCEDKKRLPDNMLLSGDIITIILDLKNQILSCIIDNGKLLNDYILFTNIWKGQRINYNMWLQLHNNGDNAKLLQFEELQGN